MLTRLSTLTPVNTRGMWIGTFHGLCNRMLRAHHRDANLPQLFQIMDTQDQLSLIKRMYKAHNLDDERFPPKQLQWFIAGAKEEGLRPNAVEAGDEFARRQVEHYALYEAMCQREGVVDFAELLLRSYELLAGNERLRDHYRRRFSHLLVDEFQDTNVLQYKWLGQLAERRDRGVRGRRRRPVDLRVPRRQRRQHAALRARLRHVGNAGAPDQARAELPLARPHPRRRQRADPPQPDAARQEPVDRATPRASRCARSPRRRDLDEAAFIVDVVKGAGADGVALDEVAVLYRSNAQSRVLEHALFNAGVPYRVYGGMRFFERAEVKHALAYLRLIAAPGDDGAFLRVVNFPPRGIGARTLESLQDAARGQGASLWQAACSGALTGKAGGSVGAFVRTIEAMRAATAGLPLPEAVEHVIEASGLVAHYRAEKDGEDRVDNLEELVNAAQGFVREAEIATDAPMLSDRVAADPGQPRRCPRRRRAGRRHRSADRVPHARGARGRRDAGGRGPRRRCS